MPYAVRNWQTPIADGPQQTFLDALPPLQVVWINVTSLSKKESGAPARWLAVVSCAPSCGARHGGSRGRDLLCQSGPRPGGFAPVRRARCEKALEVSAVFGGLETRFRAVPGNRRFGPARYGASIEGGVVAAVYDRRYVQAQTERLDSVRNYI